MKTCSRTGTKDQGQRAGGKGRRFRAGHPGHLPPHQRLTETEQGHLSQNPAGYLPMHTLEGDEAEETAG